MHKWKQDDESKVKFAIVKYIHYHKTHKLTS